MKKKDGTDVGLADHPIVNLCCGTEIIIPDGVVFPDCATHIHLITEWKNIHSSRIPHVSELGEGKRSEPAA